MDPRRLVGRDAELTRLVGWLDDPAGPDIVLAGPGGVGKTRLARAVLDHAATAGDRTATAVATRAAATVPLGPLAHLVGTPDDRPERLLATARDQLRPGDGNPRLVLHVDDAHLLDDLSAALLLQLADDPDLRLVVTLRTGETAPEPVTALWKDAGAQRVDLEPLANRDADELAELVAGGPIDEPGHVRLRHAARGMPLAVVELVRGACDAGRLVADDLGVLRLHGELTVSPRVRDLVADRLTGLSDAELSALALVALGEPLSLATLQRLGRDAVLPCLERRGLVTLSDDGDPTTVGRPLGAHHAVGPAGGAASASPWWDPGDAATLRLAHPLHGEAALDAVGELTRRSLLTELADNVEPTADTPDERLRLATWRLDAGSDVDPDLLVDAARRAWALSDHLRTARLAGAAWRARPDAAAGQLYGHALARTNRCDEAEGVLAAAECVAIDDHTRLLVNQARTDNLFRGLARVDDALDRNRAAEAELTDADCRAELRAGRAALAVQAGRLTDALELTAPLLVDGTPPRAFITASFAAGLAEAMTGRTDRALDLARAALPVHERVWETEVFSTEPGVHWMTTVMALTEAGDLTAAGDIAELGMRIAGESGRGYGFGFFATLHGHVALRRGRPATALRSCRDAVTALHAAGYPGTSRWALAGVATAATWLGDTDTACDALARCDELAPRTPIRLNEGVVDTARGWVLAGTGDPDGARTLLGERAAQLTEVGALANAGLVTHTLARLGDPAAAATLLDALSARVDGHAVGDARDHAVALARRDGAALEELADRFAGHGADLVAAECAATAAACHARDHEPRAATRAARHAAELRARCEGATTPALTVTVAAGEHPLTARELDVATLAASGLTSREVADRLHVSRRTVDNHLQRIYRKLGVTRRAELAAALNSPALNSPTPDDPAPDNPEPDSTG